MAEQTANMARAIEHLEDALSGATDPDAVIDDVFVALEKAQYRLNVEFGSATAEQREAVAEWDAEIEAEAAAPENPCPSFRASGASRSYCALEAGHAPPHDYGDDA